jgi:hypothetical protein
MFGPSIQDDPSMEGSAFDRRKEFNLSGVLQVPTERDPSQIRVYKQRQSSVVHTQRFRLRHKSIPLLKRIVRMNVGITHPAIMVTAFLMPRGERFPPGEIRRCQIRHRCGAAQTPECGKFSIPVIL